MSRETLKDFLTSIGSGADQISYVLDDSNANGMIDSGDDLGKDPGTGEQLLQLDKTGTGLLGDYTKFIISNLNYFKLMGGNEEAAPTDRGSVISVAENQGAEDVFVTISNPSTTLGMELSRYSNSGEFDDTSHTLDDLIDKTGDNPDANGNYLLADIVGSDINETGTTLISTPEDLGTEVTESTYEIFKNNSRFSPGVLGKAFSEVTTPSSELDSSDFTTVQNDFGDYDKDALTVALDDLKKIGGSLMLKATGFDNQETAYSPSTSVDPDDFNIDDLTNPETEASRQIDFELLRSKNAMGFPSIGDESARAGSGDFLSLDEATSTSYGATSTPDSPFNKPWSSTIITQAAAAIVALANVAIDFDDQFMGAISDVGKFPLGRGPLLMGESSSDVPAQTRLIRSLFLVNTDYPFRQCVDEGSKIFFGDVLRDLSQSGVEGYQFIYESPGYFLSLARSIIRSADLISQEFEEASNRGFDSSSTVKLFQVISSSKVLSLFKVLAVTGDISLIRSMGQGIEKAIEDDGFFNVDKLPDGPATRIAKSRTDDGLTNMSLSWRTSSQPALYILPRSVYGAVVDMSTAAIGTNPLKGMMATSLVTKTYLDRRLQGDSSRIPGDVVERMENLLDSEYVPFYFHDLRTNEILTFHAFLSELSDTYTANYNSSKGFGRVDPVYTYSNTDRSVSFSFIIASTSKEDFNEMWWKINKLTTLVYPQWSRGTLVQSDGGSSSFIQPFSQMISSSPLIRLRIGDVIKGNYSKFNLARIFGIGNDDVSPSADTLVSMAADAISEKAEAFVSGVENFVDAARIAVMEAFYLVYGTPLQYEGDLGGHSVSRAATSVISQGLINGFANPIVLGNVINRLQDPDSQALSVPSFGGARAVVQGAIDSISSALSLFSSFMEDEFGYQIGDNVYVKASDAGHYVTDDQTLDPDGNPYRLRLFRPLLGKVILRETLFIETISDVNEAMIFRGGSTRGRQQKTIYTVRLTDLATPGKFKDKNIRVTHNDLYPDPDQVFNRLILPLMDPMQWGASFLQPVANEAALAAGVPVDTITMDLTQASQFMSGYDELLGREANPVAKSFRSTRGRGLGGVITRLDYTWINSDTTWEIDWNSRAPKLCKVTVSFSPIHDLPPGLDNEGFNRAPLYNVGQIMEYVAGDAHEDSGAASKLAFRDAGRLGHKSKKFNE